MSPPRPPKKHKSTLAQEPLSIRSWNLLMVHIFLVIIIIYLICLLHVPESQSGKEEEAIKEHVTVSVWLMPQYIKYNGNFDAKNQQNVCCTKIILKRSLAPLACPRRRINGTTCWPWVATSVVWEGDFFSKKSSSFFWWWYKRFF